MARVREHVCKVLGIAAGKLDADRPLTELGLDSLMAVELSTRIKKDFSLELAMMKFMQGISTSGLIADVYKGLAQQAAAPGLPSPSRNGTAGGKSTAGLPDWKTEMALDQAIAVTPNLRVPVGDPSMPLLTGATGFLGSFLLHELLRQSDWRVHCLVRCRNAEQGLDASGRAWKPTCSGNPVLPRASLPCQGTLPNQSWGSRPTHPGNWRRRSMSFTTMAPTWICFSRMALSNRRTCREPGKCFP